MKLEDLGLEFMDLDSVFGSIGGKQESKGDESDDTLETTLSFGPSKTQLKTFDQWEHCDGQFFFPYNKTAKYGKISDLVTDDSKKQYQQQAHQAAQQQKTKSKKQSEEPKVSKSKENEEEPEEFDEWEVQKTGKRKKMGAQMGPSQGGRGGPVHGQGKPYGKDSRL